MKFRKRLLSCFLAVALLQGISSYLPLTVSAAQSETAEAKLLQFTEGDFSFYEIYGKENELRITGYYGDASEIVFPSEARGMKVTAVDTARCVGKYGSDGSLNGKLKKIVYSDGIEKIGTLWQKISSLESIELPDSLEKIEYYAFSDCTNLKYIKIPENITEIGYRAFQNCTNLTKINIPDNVIIRSSAFSGCTNLSDIEFQGNLKYVDFQFLGTSDNGIRNYKGPFDDTAWYNSQPNGLIYIGSNTLYTYKGEIPENSELILKNGTEIICEAAFCNCRNIKSILIPKSVTDFGADTFMNAFVDDYSIYYPGSIDEFKDITNCNHIPDNKNLTHLVYGYGAEFYLDYTKVKLGQGQTKILKATSTFENDTIRWKSSNTSVAKVNSKGKVCFKGKGTAKITAISSVSGLTAVCNVTCENGPSDISISEAAVNIGVGQAYTLKASCDGLTYISWSSSDKKTAAVKCKSFYNYKWINTIDNTYGFYNTATATVTAKKKGTVTITARASNGKTAYCRINVKAAPQSIELDKNEIELNVGESLVLNKKAYPANCATSYIWESNAPEVASVDEQGKVTAYEPGHALITLKTYNGLTAVCNVTVL